MRRNAFTLYKFIRLVLIFATLAVLSVSLTAAARTIRVGYVNTPGFTEAASTGVSGYCIDYLQEISYHTGWDYEFIAGTPQVITAALANGSIDVVCSYTKTPERLDAFDFSENDFGTVSALLYVRPDAQNVYYEDYEAFNHMRIAVVNGSFFAEKLNNYAAAHHFTYTPVSYASLDQSFAALEKGDVDAVAASNLYKTQNKKIVAIYDIEPYYIAAKKGRSDGLLREFDQAISGIRYSTPDFEANLQNTYYLSTTMPTSPLFTRAEGEYIRNRLPIQVGVMTDLYPFSYIDPNTNEPAGILEDIFHIIAQKSGLTFEFVPIAPGVSPFDELLAGKFAIYASAHVIGKNATGPDFVLSTPYFNSEMVIVGKKSAHFETDRPYTIAVPVTNRKLEQFIKRRYPAYKILPCSSPLEAMQAVADNRAEIFMANTFIARTMLQLAQFEGLTIWPHQLPEENFSMALLKGDDPVLMSILNKTIQALPPDEINTIILNRANLSAYPLTLRELASRYGTYFAGLLFLLLCLAVFFYYVRYRNKKSLLWAQQKNNELSQIIRQAEAANIDKSHFLARMSHEIRTPLNVIMGFTSLTLTQLGDSKQREMNLNKILQSSTELLDLINRILDMAALENGKLKLASDKFSLPALLLDIGNEWAILCRKKHLTFTYTPGPFPYPLVLGDARRFRQIVDNILSNGVKFTEAGGQVTVQAGQTGTDKHLQLIISDTGIGMDEGFETHIFTGSGLGLLMTRFLIRLMGGTLIIRSTKGQGTTCETTLPLPPAETAPEKIIDSPTH
jgi:signal transduction histidine kinase